MILIPEGAKADAHTLAEVFSLWSWKAPSGVRHIDARLVSSWYERRSGTKFPEVAERRSESRYPATRVWDLYEALDWYLTWVPGRAGAPLGNHNAQTHGGCVGLRAEREDRKNGT